MGVEWAETFGVYAEDADTFPDNEDYEDSSDSYWYADGIEGYYEIYDADKHDGYRVGDDNTWEQY